MSSKNVAQTLFLYPSYPFILLNQITL